MGLLQDLMTRPVEGYAEASREARHPRSRSERMRQGAVHLVIAVLLGAVTVTAIVSLRAPAPSALRSRTLLQEQIAERSLQAEELQKSNEAVGAAITALRSELLGSEGSALLEELEQSELWSGAVPVSGPGLVLEIDDAPTPPGGETDASSRVQDIDLQIVTNSLWAAGAEAIAINGQRLTSLSAVRSAASAILVGLAPLNPPYRVEVIGDVRTLQTEFARSAGANHLTLLAATYGIPSSISAEDQLTLPGAATSDVRYAAPLSADVASSLAPTQEGSP